MNIFRNEVKCIHWQKDTSGSKKSVTMILIMILSYKKYGFLRWYYNKKNPCLIGGGSCNFQPSFRGGSVSLCQKEGWAMCLLSRPHFQMLLPTPPYTFLPVPKPWNFIRYYYFIDIFNNNNNLYLYSCFTWLLKSNIRDKIRVLASWNNHRG